ncbi:hypothetical protein [Pantoea agglomerans]|uniref:hypothetical protein n=1 Tax=Enterobacter agglomerans TaxID=549 RepID=UPI0013039A39|nr:hypothetical protein [Pantoea agglomerans]
MKDIDFYRDDINEELKGVITIDNEDYAAELKIKKFQIEVRFFDSNNKMERDYSSLLELESAVFCSGGMFFRLFGMEMSGTSFRLIGQANSFNDYKFTAEGLLFSRVNLNCINEYQTLGFYSKGTDAWLGNTSKLNEIINDGFMGKVPEQESLVEFERALKNVGVVGAYYSYKYGGLGTIYTVGMSVAPHITLRFDHSVDLNGLIDKYIDLYMLMRFLTGDRLNFTSVYVHLKSGFNNEDVKFYLPEKNNTGSKLNNAMSLLYSSSYHDDSEKKFPLHIFENYFSDEDKEINLLIKKFVNYSLIDSEEERFLGFYRILERVTFKQSFYVDEAELSALLDRAKGILQKKFEKLSVSKFKRAIIRANKSKESTETCVRHYIKSMPEGFVNRMRLNEIKIDELCSVRNSMTHQPFFSVSEAKLHDCVITAKLLVSIILMSKLGVSYNLIEEVANTKGWKYGLSYLT